MARSMRMKTAKVMKTAQASESRNRPSRCGAWFVDRARRSAAWVLALRYRGSVCHFSFAYLKDFLAFSYADL
jgi:hypothetical protein